jgi:hypothetical protein
MHRQQERHHVRIDDRLEVLDRVERHLLEAVSFSPSVRAMRSIAPPGVAGTTIFTGRAG